MVVFTPYPFELPFSKNSTSPPSSTIKFTLIELFIISFEYVGGTYIGLGVTGGVYPPPPPPPPYDGNAS